MKLTLTVLLCACFSLEERVGMRTILRTSRCDTHALRAAKLLYAVLLAAALSLLFTLAPLAIFALGNGLSDASMPVHFARSGRTADWRRAARVCPGRAACAV